MDSYVSFPKLGWTIPLNEVLFEFPFFKTTIEIRWYGLLIAIGFLLAALYAFRNHKRFGLRADPMIDVVMVCTVMGIIGARLYYVLFSSTAERAAYFADPLSILRIWEGGLAIYGGVIAAFLSAIVMCRLRRVDTLRMFDLASIGFFIGQSVGRWGNFFNQEAYGGNTDLPWGMTGNIISDPTTLGNYDHALPVHPTFLYESLWCFLGFLLLHILSRKAYRFKGQLFSLYIIWYGFGRFFIEILRTDSLRLFTMKVSCLVALASVIGGILLFFYLKNRDDRLPKTIEMDDEMGGVLDEQTIPLNVKEEANDGDPN